MSGYVVTYTLRIKSCCTSIWGNKINMNHIFVLPVGWNWHEMNLWLPNEIWPYHGRTFTSVQSEIMEVQNRRLGHFPKSAFALWQVRFNNCIYFFLSIITDCSNNAPSNPCRYQVWSACACPWGHAGKCYCLSRGSDSCHRQPHPQQACCHWNFGARQVHGGYSEDHTSSKPCFVQDGARALTTRMRNLYVIRAGRKTINNQPLSRGYRA